MSQTTMKKQECAANVGRAFRPGNNGGAKAPPYRQFCNVDR